MAREFAQPFYRSKRWKTTRRVYIDSVNGLCERCLVKGYHQPGEILHHKVELTPKNIADDAIALGSGNLEYLCHRCHDDEHLIKHGNTAAGVRFDQSGNLVERYTPHGK